MAPTPRIRPATLADKESWVTSLLAGYEVDRQFQWRYPNRKQFPEDTRACCGDFFENVLASSNMKSFVAELPKIGGDPENPEWVVVSVAVWEWRDWEDVDKETAPAGSSTRPRRDQDLARHTQFVNAILAAEKKYFGPEWGKKRLELASIATDAKYQGHGAGKALMKWGLETATEHNVPLTLTASPLGKKLYTSLGFKHMGLVECEVEGDDGQKAWTYAMIWVPEGWERLSDS